MNAASDPLDVLIVGAGLSGIGAACHLQERCPGQTFEIVEARDTLGGTWDLFRYPGVRSDSDMHTLGYAFRPWTHEKAIAEGPTILRYLHDTAAEHGVLPRIRFGHRVVAAQWSSEEALWTVTLQRRADDTQVTRRTRFLYVCGGYYDYARGHQPEFPGLERFEGRLVHPQHWPEELDVRGQRIVVIGSGATAVTLVPALAQQGAKVTMLQRSPTWMASRPSIDPVDHWLRARLPLRTALKLARAKNVLLQWAVFRLCRRQPERMGRLLLAGVRQALGSSDAASMAHFTPSYGPWQQRLCLVPDADLFQSLRSGQAEVVTDAIERFDEFGIVLASGRRLDADIVVSATGLSLKMLGGIALTVDGREVDPSATVNYKGTMVSGVPNLVNVFGYTNASWTLKADLTAQWTCRLLQHMRRRGAKRAVPLGPPPEVELAPWVDFSSGYFARASHLLPKQGTRGPWRLKQSYLADWLALRWGAIEDGVLRFS